jgi:hypothetical protein
MSIFVRFWRSRLTFKIIYKTIKINYFLTTSKYQEDQGIISMHFFLEIMTSSFYSNRQYSGKFCLLTPKILKSSHEYMYTNTYMYTIPKNRRHLVRCPTSVICSEKFSHATNFKFRLMATYFTYKKIFNFFQKFKNSFIVFLNHALKTNIDQIDSLFLKIKYLLSSFHPSLESMECIGIYNKPYQSQ